MFYYIVPFTSNQIVYYTLVMAYIWLCIMLWLGLAKQFFTVFLEHPVHVLFVPMYSYLFCF